MPPATPIRLYYLGPSHYCEKARAILTYKGIPFEQVNVPYGNHQAVIKASGQDYVPYIEVPGAKGVLWPDVADWAEGRQPVPTLYPGDAKRARGLSRVIEHWAHNVVEEVVWRYVVADVPRVLKDDQERWIFVEFQERRRGPLEVMQQRKPEFLGAVNEVCAMAQGLLNGQPHLLGEEPSLADFALYGALHPLKLTHQQIPEEFGPLRAWHDRTHKIAGG